jgi:alcohol dehydrogenase
VKALHEGAFGSLEWLEERPMSGGAKAFSDLHQGLAASAKVLLVPAA